MEICDFAKKEQEQGGDVTICFAKDTDYIGDGHGLFFLSVPVSLLASDRRLQARMGKY